MSSQSNIPYYHYETHTTTYKVGKQNYDNECMKFIKTECGDDELWYDDIKKLHPTNFGFAYRAMCNTYTHDSQDNKVLVKKSVPVVIKTTNMSQVKYKNYLDNPEEEAKILRDLNKNTRIHSADCFVKVVDDFNIECLSHITHIIITEDGGLDLKDFIFKNFIRKEQPVDMERMFSIWRQLVIAVHLLHTEGQICHLDLKPENILVESTEEYDKVRIIDFGVARYLQDTGKPFGKKIGTEGYMAPEVRESNKYNPCKADLFSLGATLSFLVTSIEPNENEIPLSISSPEAELNDRLSFFERHCSSPRYPRSPQVSRKVSSLLANIMCPCENRFTLSQISEFDLN